MRLQIFLLNNNLILDFDDIRQVIKIGSLLYLSLNGNSITSLD